MSLTYTSRKIVLPLLSLTNSPGQRQRQQSRIAQAPVSGRHATGGRLAQAI
jgi:hypothetical protein